MTWYLYMIECEDGSIYTGITLDVATRYAAHVSGKGARYTRSHPPRRLLFSREYADKSSALKAECEMKRLTAGEKRTFCVQHDV
ncbi:MAG: GIY-YIG nuclease family protein [Proteobacteria bacterium]|nr:GIY-YIG nuclease family protein [Pseudomonadota bacterium]